MTNFLAALKAKSQQLNQGRDQAKPAQPMVAQQVSAPIVQNQLEALAQQIGAGISSFYDEVVKAQPRLEIVTNRNRLDVMFAIKPDQRVRDALMNQGFKYDGDRLAWYHQDNDSNRNFLRNTLYFNVPNRDSNNGGSNGTPDTRAATPSAPVLAPAISPENQDAPNGPIGSDEVTDTDHYNRYCAQVDDLLRVLKVRPCDLMLVAVDCLWKKTFN